MQILGHSKNTALECFIQFLKKSEEIKQLNKVERLELWSDRSTQWNSENTLCRRVPLFIGGPAGTWTPDRVIMSPKVTIYLDYYLLLSFSIIYRNIILVGSYWVFLNNCQVWRLIDTYMDTFSGMMDTYVCN